jgi:hypothetical protein
MSEIESIERVAERVTCPSCDEAIEPEDVEKHFAGLDEMRLTCPRQDIAAIKARRERVLRGDEVPVWARDW